MTAIRKIDRRGLLSDLKVKSMRKLLVFPFPGISQSLVKLLLVRDLETQKWEYILIHSSFYLKLPQTE